MTKPFGYYGITNPSVLDLETEYGPALCNLPEDERRTVAADLLLDERDVIAHCKRERTVVITLTQLPLNLQFAAAKAIINTL